MNSPPADQSADGAGPPEGGWARGVERLFEWCSAQVMVYSPMRCLGDVVLFRRLDGDLR